MSENNCTDFNTDNGFEKYIFNDLMAQGLSSDEFLKEFKEKQSKIRTAVEAMISEADDVAKGKGSYATYEDVFDSEREE